MLLAFSCLPACAHEPADITVKDFSHESAGDKAQRMDWFNEARFGMFIHWGLYAQPAGVWEGKEIGGIGEWIQSYAKIPVSKYSALQAKFNPVKYDAEAWVRLAKQAGMKYIVITSKHHDGFCLFDSAHTDWDIGGTPYKKDLLKPLAAACRKHGLKMCFYHSIMDWHHPQYGNKAPWRGNHATPEPDMQRYRNYMKKQLHELLTEYGDVGIVWFDGEWESSWTHEMGVDLYNYCRTLQPATIVNNRVDKGRSGMAGMTKQGEFRGDYGTPEQEIPHTGFGEGVYWESCMTMNNTWGFKKNDHQWKSPTTLVRNLIDIASKGGNFLLNVGPTAEGEIPAPSVERLQAMGQWMQKYGDSIVGTSASPFERVSWEGRCTQKALAGDQTRLYLHLFNWPEDGRLLVKSLQNKPVEAAIVGQGESLPTSGEPGRWVIQLPSQAPDKIASVVRLDIRGAAEVAPYAIEPNEQGVFLLTADDAKLDGPALRLEHVAGQPNHIGYWTDASAKVGWSIPIAKQATYVPVVRYACLDASAGSQVILQAGETKVPFKIERTGSWEKFKAVQLDPVTLAKGVQSIVLQPQSKPGQAVMNIQSVTLRPIE